MELVHCLLGRLASGCCKMSRGSVNGIRYVWWVIIGLGIATGFLIHAAAEAHINRGDPIKATVQQILDGDDLLDRLVSIRGELRDDQVLAMTKKDSKEPESDRHWVAFIDPDTNASIMIQVEDRDQESEIARHGKVVGMVRSTPRTFKDAPSLTVEGKQVPLARMIVAGERPKLAWLWGTLAMLCLLILLPMIYVCWRRYTVFRTEPPPAMNSIRIDTQERQNIDVRLSGVFRFVPNICEHFVAVPVALVDLESGNPAFLANIDGSHYWMGTLTDNRAGIWMVAMLAGRLDEPVMGVQYFGHSARPAMRISFVEADSAKERTVVVSFTDREAREVVRRMLYEPSPRAPLHEETA